MKLFYEPTQQHLAKLNAPWCASYSGGKDSTSMVTWIEWLRRAGWLTVDKPKLVNSDTGVEDEMLCGVSTKMVSHLRTYGWECQVVQPQIDEKLYNRILGIGNQPIHPAAKRMRWCTRSTKVDPMRRFALAGLMVTGLRMGESAIRDSKLKRIGCSAGGECGIPDPGEDTYSPILHWRTCHVIDWLNGAVCKNVRDKMADIFAISRQLAAIYGVRVGQPTFAFADPEISAARFGCIGCPAIMEGRKPPKSSIERYGIESPLNEIYAVWHDARKKANRCWKERTLHLGPGPIRLAVRQQLFARIMDIQKRAGVVLVTPEDEAFIRQCWVEKRYPKGWSETDELTPPPDDAPLLKEIGQ